MYSALLMLSNPVCVQGSGLDRRLNPRRCRLKPASGVSTYCENFPREYAPIRVGQAVSPAGFLSMGDYRRRLPHFHPEAKYLFLTWRLWGSLPARSSSDSNVYSTRGQAFVARDRILDRHNTGPVWLEQPPVANLVSSAIVVGDRQRHFYELCAWVVMPNHVHMLILPLVTVPILMRWLKGSTARGANRILDRTGQPFWQDESYDHYLRNCDRMDRTIAYIEENPVSAGLARSAEQWPWSSASWQAEPPAPPNPGN
jgi:putative transposase